MLSIKYTVYRCTCMYHVGIECIIGMGMIAIISLLGKKQACCENPFLKKKDFQKKKTQHLKKKFPCQVEVQ